ncbi:hypothetical protein PCASD_06118 [Puccinia coronata f. sp. avenae]|uniref:Myosin-binding domain-containing protein n=2 Tax=Puccinia coronata f. sp. avenae TaxID=200324 RepID=A0A2N5V027_9BASI|nr:hypothetical protein PCASD_06118 [Puccinia coronata f. sp. avenae]
MAEPLLFPDSPLAQYLATSVHHELQLPPTHRSMNDYYPPQNNSPFPAAGWSQVQQQSLLLANLVTLSSPLTAMLSKLKAYLLSSSQSFLTRLSSLHLSLPSASASPSAAPSAHDSTASAASFNHPSSEPLLPDSSAQLDDLQNQLSERLKYLICSSFLLNPGLQPDFYDSHSTPPMLSELDSFSEPLPSSNPPSPLRPLHRSLEFVKSFRFFRPHPRIVLSLSTLLILIGYHVSTSWALFSLPVIILTLFRPRALSAHRFRHIDIIPHLSPRTLQLEFQSAIVPEIAKLVNKCQALDLRISRAIGAVKEIECVALGLGLSNPMPPVSRLEIAAFPFSSPTPAQTTSEDNLHALGVRKVLKRVLDQARHEFENTAVELEAVIANLAPSPFGAQPTSSGSSALVALMEMYGCSRISSQESPSSLRGSATERARRQAWRASLHSRIHDGSLSPVVSNQQLQVTSTPPNSKRLSLQTPASPNRVTFESVPSPANAETRKQPLPLASRQARSRSSFGTPAQSPEFQLRTVEGSCTTDEPESSFRRSPGSRPASLYVTYSPTTPGIDRRRTSLLIPSGRSSKPRPCSMSAASYRSLASSSPHSRSYRSPELHPEIHLPSSPTHQSQELHSPVIERVVPYSLASLQNSFERMDISRKRLLCCLLALDFALFTPNTLAMWQDTLETIRGLLQTVENLGGELTAGMTAEFGPGSFDTAPTAGPNSTSNKRNSAIREPQHDVELTHEVRDFAPPIPAAQKQAKRHQDLLSQMQVMDLALRSISAKMKVCVEELEKENQSDSHGQRAISVHESIRADLESLAGEWDRSRIKIRDVVDGEKVATPGRSRLRPHSLDSNEGSLSMSSGRASSIYSSEVLTPLGERGQVGLFESGDINEEADDDEDESGPLLATIGRSQSMAPPPGLEEILASAVTPSHKAARRSGGVFQQSIRIPEQRDSGALASPLGPTPKPPKLSPEEQDELTRRRRESVVFTPRSRPHSLLNMPSSARQPNADGAQPAMVTELKDVLHALKTRRASSIDIQ